MTKTKFRGYNRVKFQSLKLGKTIFCSSLLLRDFLLHLEWDKNVQSYELKPFKISYTLEGRRRNIQPHILFEDTTNRLNIIWLKSSVSVEDNFDRIVKILTNFCEAKGFSFAVRFDNEIRKEPIFSNLKVLRKYSRSEITLEHTILCRKFFEIFSDPILGDLLEYFQSNNESAETAYALLSRRLVSADICLDYINSYIPIKLENKFPEFQNGRVIA